MLTSEFLNQLTQQLGLLAAIVAALVLAGSTTVKLGVDAIRSAFALPQGGPLIVAFVLSVVEVLGLFLSLEVPIRPSTFGVGVLSVLSLTGGAVVIHTIGKAAQRTVMERKGVRVYPTTQRLEDAP